MRLFKKIITKTGVSTEEIKERKIISPGTDKYPVYFSPSFMHHNGKVLSILQLYCRPGSNRSLRFDDVLDIIPISTDAATLTMIVEDVLLDESTKRKLVRQNATSQQAAIDDTKEQGTKTDNDKANTIIQDCDLEDYDDYALVVDSANPVIGYRIQLIICADSREIVEEQLSTLNLALARRHEGLSWDSSAGDQRQRFQDLFAGYEASRHDNTSTGDNYAGLSFAVSPGLADPAGVPIGIDVMSLAGSSSVMDYEGSLNKLAIVASTDSFVPRYAQDNDGKPIPASSVFAQAIANHVCMRGHRAHHIVLNTFDYFLDGLYWRPKESKDIFARFDVARETVNPLQGFGDIDNVVNIYARLTRKIVNIFNVLEDLKLTQDDKAIILNAVQQFYFNNSLWVVDAELYPKRTRIVDIQKPETYPTMGLLINEFTTLARQAANSNRELKADRIDTLFSVLNQAIMSHMSVIGRPTSIIDKKALQSYYEFRAIESEQMLQVQLLNIIEYVIWTADPGDVLVLHGCDKVYLTVFKHLCEAFDAAYRKNVRVVVAFDRITPANTQIDAMASIFNLKGYLYTDLDTDVDYSIIGRCMPDEISAFEVALNTPLSGTVKSQMAAKSANQFLVHRAKGGVNNFVYANTII